MDNLKGDKPGWIPLRGEPLPQPTYWPVVMAVGITAVLWGIVTSLLISLAGLALIIISICGWIVDVKNERQAN